MGAPSLLMLVRILPMLQRTKVTQNQFSLWDAGSDTTPSCGDDWSHTKNSHMCCLHPMFSLRCWPSSCLGELTRSSQARFNNPLHMTPVAQLWKQNCIHDEDSSCTQLSQAKKLLCMMINPHWNSRALLGDSNLEQGGSNEDLQATWFKC